MSTSTLRSSSQEAKEIFELKKKAFQFYADNGVPEKMEEILNSTFYDNPQDVYGHLANYFESFKKVPTISKILSREALDGKGQTTVQTEIYCTVKNFEKLVHCSICSNESYPPDSMKGDEKDLAEAERQNDVVKAMDLINNTYSLNLKDLDPTQQKDIDDVLVSTIKKLAEAEAEKLEEDGEAGEDGEEVVTARSPQPQESKTKPKSPKGKGKAPAIVIIPDEPREKFHPGSMAVCALSQALCSTAAQLNDQPLYKHIAACRHEQVPEQTHLPIAMVTIMMSGKLAPGKLNCVKEFMLIPKHDMPYRQSIKHLVNIYNYCSKNLSTKTGVVGRAVNDHGALWTAFDRPEQGLDLLQEAITHEELTPGEHFHIALNCAGHEIFDYDKGKYEVIGGQQKTAEDLVEFWTELLGRYPSVIALIDPMRKQEKESWMRLCEALSERCYIFGDVVHHRPGLLNEEELSTDFRTSGVIVHMEHVNTVSDIIATAQRMEENDMELVIGNSVGETTDTFPVDLAVGCGARFIKLGAPCRGERVAKFNYLLQIESSLEASDELLPHTEHVFPVIKPAAPPSESIEGEENTTDRSTDTKKS